LTGRAANKKIGPGAEVRKVSEIPVSETLDQGLGHRYGRSFNGPTGGSSQLAIAKHLTHSTIFNSLCLTLKLRQYPGPTGGTYAKTYEEPDLAVRELVRTISGYYVLTLDPDQLATGIKGDLQIDLREKRGTVLVRPVKVE
jgi:hypothetical protein